jgi:hypothetical protein
MNDDYWDMVDRLVPDHGVADTVQGELVRAVLRLTAECCREGCGNWDGYFESLADFAGDRFADGTLDAPVAERARALLDRLRSYGRNVDNEPESVCDELSREIDGPLEAAAVQWCQRHPAPIPFAPGPDYGAQD